MKFKEIKSQVHKHKELRIFDIIHSFGDTYEFKTKHLSKNYRINQHLIMGDSITTTIHNNKLPDVFINHLKRFTAIENFITDDVDMLMRTYDVQADAYSTNVVFSIYGKAFLVIDVMTNSMDIIGVEPPQLNEGRRVDKAYPTIEYSEIISDDNKLYNLARMFYLELNILLNKQNDKNTQKTGVQPNKQKELIRELESRLKPKILFDFAICYSTDGFVVVDFRNGNALLAHVINYVLRNNTISHEEYKSLYL